MKLFKQTWHLLFPPKQISIQESLKQSGAKLGEDVDIWNSFIDGFYRELLTIGNHVTITLSTVLLHDSTTLRETGYRKFGRVTIGDYVFISAGCIILPGTYIPNKVIVGAKCTIKGRLEGNTVYIPNSKGMPQKLCSYDEYMEKHKSRLKDYSFDIKWDTDIEGKNKIIPQIKEAETYYLKIKDIN